MKTIHGGVVALVYKTVLAKPAQNQSCKQDFFARPSLHSDPSKRPSQLFCLYRHSMGMGIPSEAKPLTSYSSCPPSAAALVSKDNNPNSQVSEPGMPDV